MTNFVRDAHSAMMARPVRAGRIGLVTQRNFRGFGEVGSRSRDTRGTGLNASGIPRQSRSGQARLARCRWVGPYIVRSGFSGVSLGKFPLDIAQYTLC